MTRARNTVLVLIAASLALILWDLRASDTTVRDAVQEVTAPLQRTATAVFAPLGSWARQAQGFDDPAARAQTASQIVVAAPDGWNGAAGRVVAADISGGRAAVTIDVGSSDGVGIGNAVLAPGGLIGQISQVSQHAAMVLLVTDPQSTIGIRVLPSKEMGVVSGSGMGNELQVEVLNPAAQIAAGQQVRSLGSTAADGIPPDLLVGQITSIDPAPASGRAAQVRPVTSMTSLDTLLVLTGRR
ncbi:MAG: rod shape-determining protein MreC [Candidatus Nanopelagicales bacterium]